MEEKKKLIVILGPTAVGKTSVGIRVATHFSTEIISADSRQIFREMNIGTAKPTEGELASIPHHFVNSHSITQSYDAASFGRDALSLIHKLFTNHQYLVLCGGSGLYIKAVCEGFDDIPEIPVHIREQLIREFETSGIEILQDKLLQVDPELYPRIDNKNPQRLIRALEVVIGTGKSITSFQGGEKLSHDFDIIKIGLALPRAELYERIDQRMDDMIIHGLFEEAEGLYDRRNLNALQTVGYQEIFNFLDGEYDRTEAIRLLKRNTRHYAKRQMTWFRRDPDIIWTDPVNIDKIISLASRP